MEAGFLSCNTRRHTAVSLARPGLGLAAASRRGGRVCGRLGAPCLAAGRTCAAAVGRDCGGGAGLTASATCAHFVGKKPPPQSAPGVGLGAEAPGFRRRLDGAAAAGHSGRPSATYGSAYYLFFGGAGATCLLPHTVSTWRRCSPALTAADEESAAFGGRGLLPEKSLPQHRWATHALPRPAARLQPYATAPPALPARLALPSLLAIERL